MTTARFEAGMRVDVVLDATSDLHKTQWWPKTGRVTGTVQKVFKSGKVAVAIDQIRNRSEDGCVTIHFSGVHQLHPMA